jgi:hypothetical protein
MLEERLKGRRVSSTACDLRNFCFRKQGVKREYPEVISSFTLLKLREFGLEELTVMKARM